MNPVLNQTPFQQTGASNGLYASQQDNMQLRNEERKCLLRFQKIITDSADGLELSNTERKPDSDSSDISSIFTNQSAVTKKIPQFATFEADNWFLISFVQFIFIKKKKR